MTDYEHFTLVCGIITDESKINQFLAEYVNQMYGEKAKYQLIRFEQRTNSTGIFFTVNRKHQKTHVSYDSAGGNRRRHTRT